MTDCEPPRCFGVKARCQCPNSWIEYLSKEAQERQGKGVTEIIDQETRCQLQEVEAIRQVQDKKTDERVP